MKLLIPLHQVPLGEIITKVRGQKEYIVRNVITVYFHDDKPHTKIHAELGTVFLVDPSSGIGNAVNASTEVVWETNINIIYNMIDEGDLL